MNNLEEFVYINRLLDMYANMLTKSQLEIMNDYYRCNLSLSEISEMRNISRTAVSDALKKGRTKLLDVESKLGIIKVFDSFKDENEKELVEKIEERIKDGI
jgi:predicted DNA-binding protein YlxM (UPF0122 family)